jgi:hypothetical protein
VNNFDKPMLSLYEYLRSTCIMRSVRKKYTLLARVLPFVVAVSVIALIWFRPLSSSRSPHFRAVPGVQVLYQADTGALTDSDEIVLAELPASISLEKVLPSRLARCAGTSVCVPPWTQLLRCRRICYSIQRTRRRRNLRIVSNIC